MNYENITRKELLQKYAGLVNQIDEINWNQAEAGEVELPEDADTLDHFVSVDDESTHIGEEIYQLREAYKNNLPDLAISRCPFTGEVLYCSIDNQGLDGLWWNYYDPVRKGPPNLRTFLALTGSMKLNRPIELTSFPVEVGPEIPYVLPALLDDDKVLAVLSSFTIGQHTAYVVVYYAQNPSSVILRPNEWGTDRYYYQDETGETVWSQADDAMEIKDFDLTPWIEAGKLFWVMPGDKGINLRADTRLCPFLEMEGNPNSQIIQNGELIELEVDDELDSEVEEILSTLEVEDEDDLTPVPEELWKILPQEEGGNNEQ